MRKEILKDLYLHYRDKLSRCGRLYIALRLKMLPIDEYLKVLRPEAKILSLGCGLGLAEYYFAADSPLRRILAIDNNAARITIAQNSSRHLKNIEYQNRYAQDVARMGNEEWDVVLASDLFHHIDYGSQEKIVCQAGRILKKGGLFIVKDMNPTAGPRKLYNTLHDRLFNKTKKIYYIEIECLKKLMSENSLRLNSLKYINTLVFSHILLVAEKI